jgi:hypothetical protein
MKKIFKSWKLVFLCGLIFLIGLFFFSQLIVQMKQPSSAWSRELQLTEVNDSRVNDSTRVRVTTVPIPDENRFIVFWNERDSIKYISVNSIGVKSEIKVIPIKLDEPRELKAVLNGNKIDLYGIIGGKLTEYSFDYKTGKFTYDKVISSGVLSFIFNGRSLFIAGENFVKFIDEKGKITLISKSGGEVIDSILSPGGVYKIAYYKTYDDGSLRTHYTTFNPKTMETTTNEIGNIINSTSNPQSVDNIVISNQNDKIYVILPIRNLSSNDTRTILYSFDEKNIKNVNITNLDDINGYNPSPVRIYENSNEMAFLASISGLKGNKIQVINIKKFILRNGVLIPDIWLTKTDDISMDDNFFKLGNTSYLQWSDITGSSTKIMFASTGKEILSSAGRIRKDEVINEFLNCLMAMGFGLSYMLLTFSVIIFPTLVLAIIASVFLMSWVESNPRKVTFIFVIVHIIAELLLTSHSILQKPKILGLMPDFMQHSIIIYGLVILIGLITYLCVKLKFNDDKMDKSFMNQYAFFAILNMVLYSLLFFPYYYL